MTQKIITGLVFTGLLGAAVVGTTQPGSARVGETEGRTILINGQVFQGSWAYIHERPYVSVHAFERILHLPHHHDGRNWYLGNTGSAQGSMLEPGVEGPKGKLPSVNYGGTMMVDLQAACQALHLHFRPDFETRSYYVRS